MKKIKLPKQIINEDWLSVIIALAVIALTFLTEPQELPWPFFGWFK